MKAIQIIDGRLRWSEFPTPKPGPGQVLLKVAATAVNRADLSQRSGRYPPPPGASEILGLECSGTVAQLGPGVVAPALGTEVCALLSGGGYAEYVCVPASHTLPIPTGLTLEEAGAVPEVFATAWLNLKLEGQLQPDEHVLVHAGASGVGTACIQLCKAWGNPVFVTVGSEEKARFCLDLGASGAANRRAGPWSVAVKEWGGADVILDPVGAHYLQDNILSLRPRGRLINIGLMGGSEGTLPLGPVLVKRLTVKGSVLRSRSVQEKNVVMQGLHHEVWPLLEEGAVRLIVDRVLSIEEAETAHAVVQSDATVGKVIMTVP
ncbi:NAD(P)H-quinone oxidoreductase [bacterium]|nr:NAD(P)H-quinone oxidoreductase [bacterium]